MGFQTHCELVCLLPCVEPRVSLEGMFLPSCVFLSVFATESLALAQIFHSSKYPWQCSPPHLPISRSPGTDWKLADERTQKTNFCSPPLRSLGQFPFCLLDLHETPHTKDWERQSWKSGRGEKQSSEQEHSPGKDSSEPGGQGWCLRGSCREQSIILLGKTAPLCVHLLIHPSLHASFQLVFTECPPSLMFSRSSQSIGDVRAPNKSPDHELQIDLRAWKEQQGSRWGNVWPLL